MSHATAFLQSPFGLAQGLATWRTDALARWRQAPTVRRVSVWQGAAASLVVLGLLGAFHQVVSGVVEQAALQRKTLVRNATETLRCKTLPGRDARSQCLAQVFTQIGPNSTAPARLLAGGERLAIR